MIYDCNHQAAPATTQGDISITSASTSTQMKSATSTNAPATATPSTSQQGGQGNGSKGLSKADIAGIVIGTVAAVTGIFALAIAGLERWKKLPS